MAGLYFYQAGHVFVFIAGGLQPHLFFYLGKGGDRPVEVFCRVGRGDLCAYPRLSLWDYGVEEAGHIDALLKQA